MEGLPDCGDPISIAKDPRSGLTHGGGTPLQVRAASATAMLISACRQRTDRNVISIRIPERELVRSSVRVDENHASMISSFFCPCFEQRRNRSAIVRNQRRVPQEQPPSARPTRAFALQCRHVSTLGTSMAITKLSSREFNQETSRAKRAAKSGGMAERTANADAKWIASSVRMGSAGNGWLARSTISGLTRHKCQWLAAIFKCARRSAAAASSISPRVTAADQHAITLNQRKIGGHHQFGVLKHLTHRVTSFLSEQPRYYRAGLRINVHRALRS